MNILITGASGLIGRNLITFFHEKNINITALTRNKSKFNDNRLNIIENLKEIPNNYTCDAIINLAGSPIDKRWSRLYKKTLLNSRLDITKALYTLIARLDIRPKTVISASAVGYYGSLNDNVIDESSKPNQGFTHELCRLWEQEALKIRTLDCRVFIIRLGVVLIKDSGMLRKILPPFKIGLGGKIGSGKQYISWIHIHDVLRAVFFLLESNNSTVIYNLASPFPVTNSEWTESLSSLLKRPACLTMPRGIVRLLFGEMGETLLLKGQRVIPNNLTKAGFKFKYNTINNT